VRYIARHGRVARAVLINAVQPPMVQERVAA
jgi:hypothetical protein